TLITYGAMVHTSLKAAEQIEKEKGVKVEVIDLRTISPIDIETIMISIRKTNRAIVVQEAQQTAGIAAEVIAQINEKGILYIEAPVLRVAQPDTVYPFTQIENTWLPTVDRIKSNIDEVRDF